ncbi:MoaD/ThiS family protein [Stenotrophomonas rhizophila]|jgi:molybdopterin synthase sulfur carrier subunit|uniref:MoaD/ThiS family protein n=1 Tax=Stenotrophomonas rhizophila TaxID=216778 RepID=UPI00119FA0E9|nr:MoaD/ThiS family protein [Stenotrophomonas rhizophila]
MNMIELQLFGAFSELVPERVLQVEVEGESVADLRRALQVQLAARWPTFRSGLLDYSAFADEQRVLRDDDALPVDGRVAVLPPVSGG